MKTDCRTWTSPVLCSQCAQGRSEGFLGFPARFLFLSTSSASHSWEARCSWSFRNPRGLPGSFGMLALSFLMLPLREMADGTWVAYVTASLSPPGQTSPVHHGALLPAEPGPSASGHCQQSSPARFLPTRAGEH